MASESASLYVADRLATVLEPCRRISSALTREEVYAAVQGAALSLVRGERCVVLERQGASQMIAVVGQGAWSADLVLRAMETGQAVRSDGAAAESDDRSALCVPFFTRGMAAGCFYVAHSQVDRRFGEAEAQLAEFISTLAGTALENADGFHMARQALEESEERFRAVVQPSLEAMCLLDPQTLKVQWANPAFCRLLGYREDEASAMSLADFAENDTVRVDLGEVVRQGARDFGERRWRSKDGTHRDVHVRASSIVQGGRKIIYLVGRNVTERKAAEAALRQSGEQLRQAQKMEAIGRLAGGVAHDFNNLLTGINGLCSLMLAQLADTDPLRRDVEEIRGAGERAAWLTKQLLGFSRLQGVAPQVLDVNVAVSHSIRMLRRLIGENIDLVTRLLPEPAPVEMDPGQFEQIILNLALNARDAISGTGRIDFEISRGPGGFILLALSDTGCGMDEDVQQHIFEPFYTTKAQGEGTGLGLSTVHDIVSQHGGTIRVESVKGRGTRFEICLPRVELGGTTSVSPPQSGPARRTESILVVEDEELIRHVARRILTKGGFTVLEAADGIEALAVCERNAGAVHAVVTDVIMPRMGGRELAEHLAQRYPEVKVLYISGHTEENVIRLIADAPFLPKPFTTEGLLLKVSQVLDQGKPSQRLG